ncbi:hypothetical protein PSPO01_07048 [Paraphaeosphaeria sporulosa]
MHAGDDLLRYLIVPGQTSSTGPASPSRFPPSSSDPQSLLHQEEPGHTPGAHSGKRRKMEVDAPSAMPAVPGSSNMPGQILSIDDFKAQAMRKNSASAIKPCPETQPQPRALASRSSKFTIELHEKYQAYGIPRPEFVFSGDGEEGFRVSTEFMGKELHVTEPCGSKQEAKERLSEACLKVLKQLESEGKLERASKAKKQKMEHAQPEVIEKGKEKMPVVNYIGQLLEFQRSIASPQPTYIDYQLGQSFSCELTIDGHPDPFGSRTTFFTSKKAARQHAASCAVAHFQAAGLWPKTATHLGGIKKVKSPPVPTSGSTIPTSLASTSSSADNLPGASSYAQRAAHLATQLGLNTPEWRYAASSASAQGFHTVSCFFKNGGPHEDPNCEVRHVFGKKKAKEECARLVLQYLEGVREKRMEHARGVMAGMKGCETVVGRAVGKVAEGEELGSVQMEVEESGDEEFESANEGTD